MMPEFTRPTSITVMAEEDWMAMVMPAPSSRLLKRLSVIRLRVPPEKREALLAVLAQDPRPSYQEDPDRVYGMAFAGLQVRFTAGGGRLRVVDISK